MTKKEYLNQAYWLDRRIDSKLEQLSALKDMATRTTSVMSGEVVSHTRNVSSMQDVIVKIITMENEVNADIDRLVDLKAEIMRVIKAVASPEAKPRLALGHHLLSTPTPLDQTMDWQNPFIPQSTAITGMELWKEMMTFSTAEAATPNIIKRL